ncbi:contractile injection system tape measure protein [Pedobacter sp. L105]|uniref:contractile injection system tape measure protein n=1 Tax=Pedobacter sp. L105 TaxID=1641871 RepID=UPI00131DF8A7|nr:contractile injection system tape measure protein [Pedobacter sp. L105]
MSESHFSIQELSFNLDFFSKEKAYELQNRISRLYHRQLHHILNDFFENNIPENLLIRKDSLLLDLGTISDGQLETELPERIEKALKEQFYLLLYSSDTAHYLTTQGFESLPAALGYRDLLEYYLLNGTFPWQASAGQQFTWRSILQELDQQNRDELGDLLKEFGWQQQVRRRIAYQSRQEEMGIVITAIIPAEAALILSYQKKIINLQQEKQIVKADTTEFAQSVSFFILTYLLEDKGSLFSQKMFIRSILLQMAAHYNITYSQLLTVLYYALPLKRPLAHGGSSLFELVEELQQENLEPVGFTTAPLQPGIGITRSALLLTNKTSLLQYYLSQGSLPVWSSSFSFSKADLSTMLKEGMHTIPATLREMIFSLATQETVIERIGQLLPINELAGFIRFLWPHDADFIGEFLLLLLQSKGKKLIMNGYTGSFEVLLQQMIMRYLVTANTPGFNKNNFIRFSLEYISTYSNTEIKTILNTLINGTGTSDNVQISTHLRLLKNSAETNPVSNLILATPRYSSLPDGSSSIPVAQSIEINQNTLSDILHYFLQYGTMPWWGQKYSSQSPESLLRKLYTLSPHKALMVFKRAGMQKRSRQRFLWQFNEELIYLLFRLLPEWDIVEATIETAIELIESIPELNLSQLSLKHLIIEATWSGYMRFEYTAFETHHFYRYIFEHLLQLTALQKNSQVPDQHHDLPYHWITDLLKQNKWELQEILQRWQNFHQSGTIDKNSYTTVSQFGQLIKHLDNSTRDLLISPAEITTGKIQYKNVDLLILQHRGSKVIESPEERQKQVVGLLEYYLTWNRLPDTLHTITQQELDDHLSEMLLLLYNQNRDALKQLLQSEKHSSSARMHLHRLFLPDRKGGDHKQLSLLLDHYIEKDALQYIKEIAEHGNLAGAQELKPVLDRLLESARSGATDELTLLLKSIPLTKYMARNYGEETVNWLIDHRSSSDLTFKVQSNLVRNLLLELINDTHEKQSLRILLNEATLFYLSGMEKPKNVMGYIKYLFSFLSGSVYASANLFTILLRKIKTDTLLLAEHKDLSTAIKRELEQYSQIREQEAAIKHAIEKSERNLKEADAAAKGVREKIEQELAIQQLQEEQKRRKKMEPILEKGNKLYVNNSGLILLHPFLSTYFTRLQLMDKGDFVNAEARARAVHLLQYLAFNTTAHPEQELVLNKIICNHPLHEPLPLEIVLTPEEADLSLELLKVVIERSGKLSSTSVEGFQASFLQRQGVIAETEETWMLRVEQRGYDIILQTLPWAFGIIRFQWMDKTITVEWI